MNQMLSLLTTFIIHVISTLGYAGIFFLMTLHSAAIPVPSEVVMPFSGYLASVGRFSLPAVIAMGTLGNLLGASIIYWLAKSGGRELVMKYGKYLLISRHDIDAADKFFARFGSLAVFLGRCLPVVATFIAIPAGIARVKYRWFFLATVLGALVWNAFLSIVGFQLGAHWESLRGSFQKFDALIVAVIVVGAVWWIWRHVKNSRVDGSPES